MLHSLEDDGLTPLSLIDKPSLLHECYPQIDRGAYYSLLGGQLQAEADRIEKQCRQLGIEIIGLYEDDYPELLRQCPDAPLVLYVRGNVVCYRERNTLSIVGTRRCTPYGVEMTRRLVSELSATSHPLTIVSGLALGIDIAAHRAAMSEAIPTIAVLAGGLERIYPHVHQADAYALLDRGGALISETPPHASIEASNFLLRNRLIAGLSSGTLVVEAGLRSGAMSTARLALAYDRSLFAVPGRATDPESAGCNQLLSMPCALLTTRATTILEELGLDA